MQVNTSSSTKEFLVNGRAVRVRYTIREYIGFFCEPPIMVDLDSTEELSEEEKSMIVNELLHDRSKDNKEYEETQADRYEYKSELICEEERGN